MTEYLSARPVGVVRQITAASVTGTRLTGQRVVWFDDVRQQLLLCKVTVVTRSTAVLGLTPNDAGQRFRLEDLVAVLFIVEAHVVRTGHEA